MRPTLCRRQISCNPLGLALAALFLGGVLGIISCDRAAPAPESQTNEKRYQFVRGTNLLLRIDSATGAVSITADTGDGGWETLVSPPDPQDFPNRSGRYGLFNLKSGMMGGPARLLRVDRSSGRAWLGRSEVGVEWNPIEELAAEPGTQEGDPPPTESSPQEESDTDSAAASGPSEASPEVSLQVVSLETIENSPGDESDKIKIVIQALEKEGLATEIKVWAASQLAVFPHESALPPLLKALETQQPAVVVAAIESLRKLGRPRTIPKILALADHPDPRVRAAVQAVVVPVP